MANVIQIFKQINLIKQTCETYFEPKLFLTAFYVCLGDV